MQRLRIKQLRGTANPQTAAAQRILVLVATLAVAWILLLVWHVNYPETWLHLPHQKHHAELHDRYVAAAQSQVAAALLELSPGGGRKRGSFLLGQSVAGATGAPALRMYVLDVDIDLAPTLGFPQCVLSPHNITLRYPAASMALQTLPLQGKLSVTRSAHHLEGYFLQYTLHRVEMGAHRAEDMRDADVVVVQDRCYYRWFQECLDKHHATQNTAWQEAAQRVDRIRKQYMDAIRELPRFIASQGRDFVFIGTHPFYRQRWLHDRCQQMPNSVFLLDLEDTCAPKSPAGPAATSAAVPYFVPGYPRIAARRPQRDMLLWYRGMCKLGWSYGHVLRHMLVSALNARHSGDPDVELVCYEEGEMPAKFVGQDGIISSFYAAKFCLVLVGDASSSRRIVEAIRYGCVPVFVGPPYHTEVLPSFVDMAQLGVTFRLSRDVIQKLESEDTAHPNTQRFWKEVDKNYVPGYVARGGVDVDGVEEIVPQLRVLAAGERLEQLQRNLQVAASVLTYDVRGGGAVQAAMWEIARVRDGLRQAGQDRIDVAG